MKYLFYPALLLTYFLFSFQATSNAAADVTITSATVPAGNITQGSATNVVYIAKMAVATEAVTVNSVNVPLGGTHDANDLSVIYVYFNPTDPTIAGASLLNGLNANFAAPHTYDISVSKAFAPGESGYFIITVSTAATASDAKTIKVNGSTGPVVFGFTTSPNITNNQSNASGTLTIEAADVTLTSAAVAAGVITQGSATNVVYIAKMNVATQGVTVNNVQVALGGNHDANDLSVIYVYFNPTDPTIAGASLLNGLNANFAAPHTYDVSVSKAFASGESGYFIITVSTTATASDGKTVKVNGSTDPVVFGFTTAPNITNNQSNASGLLTIDAADVTLTSAAVPAGVITQGSATNVVYIAKMAVATEAATVSNVEVPLGGSHDANDLSVIYVYFNPTDPTIAGASLLNGLNANFAAPHTYDISVSKAFAPGESGYFIVTVSTTAAASDGKTVKVNGSTDPVVFGFTTAPNITNNQSNASGLLTIDAADVTLTSAAVPAGVITQGSATNVVYIAKMAVATEAATVSNVEVPLGGSHDANDLSVIYVYFNPTDPTIAGASLLNGLNANFAAPHTYDISVSKAFAPGESGYFIVTVSTTAAASDGKTVKVNGSTAPVMFGFTTAPNITNNQSNASGTLTIEAADVTLTSAAVPAGVITQGSATNVVYIAKMDVATQAVTVSNVRVALGGTHDANDLSVIYVYFNPTDPTIAGASLLNGLNANFAAPHTYDIGVSKVLAAGESGYFLATVTATSTATLGNTIKVNGAANPVIFTFTTAPNITDNQTDNAGVQVLPVTIISLTAKAINGAVQVNWVTASETNNAFFEIERSADGVSFTTLGKVPGNGSTAQTHSYTFVDELPGYGNNYYRLKQTDLDGHSKYSEIVKVIFNADGFVMSKVYPDPAKDVLNYSVLSPVKAKLELQLSDISGRIVLTKMITVNQGPNLFTLDISHFGNGHYYLSVVDPEKNIRMGKQVIIIH